MYEFSKYLDYLLAGYGISTIVFLLISVFQKRFRKLKSDYLNIANLLALFLSIAVTVIQIVNHLSDRTSITEKDLVSPGYRMQFYLALLFSGLVPLLFLFKRLRKTVWVTLIVVVAINWSLIYERVEIWIAQLYRDYLPSAWSPAYPSERILPIIIAAVVYFALAFIASNWTKKQRLT